MPSIDPTSVSGEQRCLHGTLGPVGASKVTGRGPPEGPRRWREQSVQKGIYRSYVRTEIVTMSLLLTVGVGVTGCGQHDSPSAGVAPSPGYSSRVPLPVHSFRVPLSGALPLPRLSLRQAKNLKPLLSKIMGLENNGDKVVVLVETPCSRPEGAVVNASSSSITISIVGTSPGPSTFCAGTGGGTLAAVELPGTVGSRTLRLLAK